MYWQLGQVPVGMRKRTESLCNRVDKVGLLLALWHSRLKVDKVLASSQRLPVATFRFFIMSKLDKITNPHSSDVFFFFLASDWLLSQPSDC